MIINNVELDVIFACDLFPGQLAAVQFRIQSCGQMIWKLIKCKSMQTKYLSIEYP